MKRSKEDWKDLAKYRILKVLRKRRVCCLRQLEVKVSESGPGGMRPEPIFLTNALGELKKEEKTVVLPKENKNETPFYASRDFDLKREKDVYDSILLLYRKHKFFTEKPEYCSEVLESIITKSIQATGGYTFLSKPFKPNIPKVNPLDFVIKLDKTTIGGEVKNYREWIYPDKLEIWELIKKCIEINASPIFITRKIPYVSRLFFSKIGVLGLETHNQYFAPILKEELKQIIHKDYLGYKDIKASDEVEPRYVNFFKKTVVDNIHKYSTLFKNNLPLLKSCIEKGMAEKGTSMGKKQSLFNDLKQEIFWKKREEEQEVEGYYYEEEDTF